MRLVGPAARLLMMAVAALVLLPVAASAQVLYADLNGDGIHDRVDPGVRATELIVRFSAGQHQRRLHADSPIIRLAAIDFNRDGNVDLVATTVSPGRLTPTELTVWINRGNGRFSRHRATRPAGERLEGRAAGTSPRPHGLQPDDNSDDLASRPLLVTTTVVGSHEFSYIKRLRVNQVADTRFKGRSTIARGPPSDQLF
jgi:hypothetical protein